MSDAMLEKMIQDKATYHQSLGLVVSVDDLRTFMAGKRIVEDVPVAFRVRSKGITFHFSSAEEAARQLPNAEVIPLYAAPSDAEVGK